MSRGTWLPNTLTEQVTAARIAPLAVARSHKAGVDQGRAGEDQPGSVLGLRCAVLQWGTGIRDPERGYTFGLHTILAGLEVLISGKTKASSVGPPQ